MARVAAGGDADVRIFGHEQVRVARTVREHPPNVVASSPAIAFARPRLLKRFIRARSSTPRRAGRSHQWLGAREVACMCPRLEASRAIGSLSHVPDGYVYGIPYAGHTL
jgi:hypothetical protein